MTLSGLRWCLPAHPFSRYDSFAWGCEYETAGVHRGPRQHGGDYPKLFPELVKEYTDFSLAAAKASIDAKLAHLVELRVSQINGCAFCVDMHVKQLKIAGESALRLYHVIIWHESQLFSHASGPHWNGPRC